MIEVFGQTFGIDNGVCLTFRTCKTQRRANFWVWFYSKCGYSLPHYSAPLSFDSAPVGEGWL